MATKKVRNYPVGTGMTPSRTDLGNYIRARRVELGLRQTQLAKKCGFAQNSLSMIELGTRKHLDNRKLEKLAKALQCDPEELRKRMPIKPVAMPKTELGKLIRSRREELGLSLEAFAKKMKVTPKQAELMEIGRSRTISYGRFRPLVTALELDPAAITPFVGSTRKESKSELGNLVRSRRKELGMSINQLAEKLGVSRQFVDQIEFGICRLSKNDAAIVKLAQILQLDAAKLEAVRPRRKVIHVKTASPLGGFLASKRLELNLSRREVGKQVEVSIGLIAGVEAGRIRPRSYLLERLTKALNCQIPPELIPPPREQRAPGFEIERKSPLGEFITTRRLELKLSQAKVASRADTDAAVISRVEGGMRQPGRDLLERIAKALECKIPDELVPEYKRRHRTSTDAPSWVLIHLSDQDRADLEKSKELSGIRTNPEAVRKALKILRRLLERQNDGYTVCLRKGEDVVELEILF